MIIPLENEIIKLIPITREDLPFIHEMNSFKEVAQYNTIGIPESIADTEKLFEKYIDTNKDTSTLLWSMRNANNEFVGDLGMNLKPTKYAGGEIYYSLMPKYWKLGYATQAVKLVLSYAFDHLKLHRITAGTATANVGSIRVLEKNGFRKEGHHRKILPLASGWSDNYEFAILEEDYKKLM